MKKFIKIFVLFFSISTSLLVVSEKAGAQQVSFQVFYDDLSPYGSWFQSPDYGYVWRPQLAGFSPYSTGGYWVLTDAGWTWVSDYSWGWAPFHYGRWYNDPFYGYVWVPGYEWGPGWVSWRRSNDYYGWAPIGPGVSLGVAYGNGYNIPYNNWNFVACNNFGRRDIRNHYVDRSKNVTIINNTTVINNTKVDNTRKTTFNVGPDRMEVQKKSGRTYAPVAIVDEKKPAQRVTKNSVQLYRPDVKENIATGGTKPAPKKITPIEEVKKANTNPTKTEAINDRRSKQIPLQNDDAAPVNNNNQPVKQNNDQPQKQPVKQQPVRDEQTTQPVKQPPIQIQQDNKKEIELQPDRQPRPVRKEREQQVTQPETPQKQPEVQQQQPVKQAPVQEQPLQQQREQPQQQPVRQQPVQQQPQRQQRQQPVREQRVQQPQQRMQPVQRAQPQQRVQQPMRQPSIQRAPTPQGGGRRPN